MDFRVKLAWRQQNFPFRLSRSQRSSSSVLTPNPAAPVPASDISQRGSSYVSTRAYGRGQGGSGGWPSSTGNPSGGGRYNNPAKTEKERDARGRELIYSLFEYEHVDKCFDEKVTSMACGGKATIMVFEDGGSAWTNGLTRKLYNKLNGRQKSLPGPDYVAMGSQDRYYIRFNDGKSEWVGCEEMSETLKETDRSVKSVAFGEGWNSYFIVFEDGSYSGKNVPQESCDLLKQRNKADLECVSLGPDGEYYVSVKNGKAWWGGTTQENLDVIAKVRDRVQFIDLGDDDAYFCRYT